MNNLFIDNIHDSWKSILKEEFSSEYFSELCSFLESEYKTEEIYPEKENIFNAFNSTPLNNVKVVILGQDPYHGKGQAHGLCFSVQHGIKPPPSLVNIFKEIYSDLNIPIPNHGYLQSWADQGILLLNAILTVRANTPGSHQKQGWERFTDSVIRKISEEKEGIVFLLWGKYAESKAELIDKTKHHVLTAPHPSPFSANRGFFGCRHFSKTNEILKTQGKEPINWAISYDLFSGI